MKTWYNLAANDTLTVFDDIGAYGVSAKSFLDDLKSIKAEAVNVEINSPGGDVFAGLAIYNGLRASGKKINVKVMGIAASAASLVAMAGDEIEMPENAMMMIHNPWTFAVGDADELRATADVLDKIGTSLVTTYAKRTGKDEDEIKSMLDTETWLSAQEALDMGFATKVLPAVEARASFDLERLPERARVAYALAQEDAKDVDPEHPDADEDTRHGSVSNEVGVPAATHADQVVEVSAALGMEAYAAQWALDPKLADLAAVKARAAEAREIKSLCVLAKREAMADQLIRKGTPLAEARAAIFAAMEDEEAHVDTSPQASNTQSQGAQPAAVKTSDIWAARRKHLQGA
ncbi:MAG: Clp protease ClpP [Dechloromonas sp.]|nr:Clp protease ClpP [Dechloromonas sp.]